METPISDNLVERLGELFRDGPKGEEQAKWTIIQIAEAIARVEERMNEIDPSIEPHTPSLADGRAHGDRRNRHARELGLID